MSSIWGERLKISIFGESHASAIGVVVDGIPAGECIDFKKLQSFLDRRAPGRRAFHTPRRESDVPEFVAGVQNGVTTGAPILALIRNENTRSKDYDLFRDVPRPSHADYPALLRYHGFQDIRGGGHFSGRLTAPLCIAGALALQILSRKGVAVGAHISAIGAARDEPFDPVGIRADLLQEVAGKILPVLDDRAGEEMLEIIEAARMEEDSVGGVIECAAVGYPGGIGTPMFDGLENRISAAMFSIPAVRGIEFGAGFSAADMRGSTHNDEYTVDNGSIRTKTNHHGGIIGGISTGMPIVLRIAVKPTPSIGREQGSIRLSSMEAVPLKIEGRHDPCIVPRAVPCVEAVMGIVLLDRLLCEAG